MSLKDKAYNKSEKFLLALDGPSASGKGLIGTMLANEFCLQYFQSSLVYRGLAYICLEDRICVNSSQDIIAIAKNADIFKRIENVNLNDEKIGDMASQMSVIPQVREHLGRYLKSIIINNSRVVMEGRDIGTVIAPDAHLKLFLKADVKVRADRRYKQLIQAGKECILGDVLELLKERDKRDQSRATAPLVAASDAYVLDTTNLSPTQVIQKIKNIINESD